MINASLSLQNWLVLYKKNSTGQRKRRCHGEEEYEVTCKRLYVKIIAFFAKLTTDFPSLKSWNIFFYSILAEFKG
jgi:hypothetical protein